MPKETILVIDSDTETAQQMVMTLEEEDYLVFTAPSSGMGVAMAKKVNPSLIFLSLASGGGLEVCREIREIGALKDVPIIVLSSFEGASDPRYASEYGIVDSLGRSCTDEELVSKTRRALSLKMEEARSGARGDRDSGEGEGPAMDEQVTPLENKDDGETVSSSHAGGEREAFSGTPEEEGEQEGRGIRDFSYHEDKMPDEDQERPLQEKRRGRTRRRSKRPSIAFIAILIILGLATAIVVFFSDTLMSWIGGRSQEPVSRPVVAKKAVVEPSPASSPQTKVEKEETSERKIPVPEEKSLTPPPPPAGQTAVAKAVPKTDSGQSDEPKYSVQMGAFKNGNNAEGLAGQFREKGYDAFVLKGMKNGETVYRVLIGRFEDLRKASAMAATVNAKEHVKVTVFRGQNQSR
ncbi:MAG TPA: SPOR domain-containing protein [Thermodesulfovibrionales bacterium]|nr:SPOR domain-containing protein [Thermodesulfovibrionales bacterium]